MKSDNKKQVLFSIDNPAKDALDSISKYYNLSKIKVISSLIDRFLSLDLNQQKEFKLPKKKSHNVGGKIDLNLMKEFDSQIKGLDSNKTYILEKLLKDEKKNILKQKNKSTNELK